MFHGFLAGGCGGGGGKSGDRASRPLQVGIVKEDALTIMASPSGNRAVLRLPEGGILGPAFEFDGR